MLSRNLLCTNFVIQPRNWLSLCIFKNVDPVIKLNPDTKPSVPLGATVTFELPEKFRTVAQRDAARRRDDSGSLVGWVERSETQQRSLGCAALNPTYKLI